MLPRAVALVPDETILGKFLVDGGHDSIPCHLRNHARSSYGKRFPVTLHQRLMWQGKTLHRQAVDQCDGRLFRKRVQRKTHRTVCGTQDVDLIDLRSLDKPHRPYDLRIASDLLIEHFATLLGQLLGIVQQWT